DPLRRHVPDAVAVGAAREAPVGHESTVRPSPGTLHGAGDSEHLAHAWTTLRAFVTDHDDGPWLDPAGEDRFESSLLAVEDPGRPGELWILVEACHLHDAALGCERALEDRDAPGRVDGLHQGADDLAVGCRRIDGLEVLGHRQPR